MQRLPGATDGVALKHEVELGKCKDQPCPKLTKFKPRDEKNCYRFLHGPTATNGDFVPFAETTFGKVTAKGRNPTHWKCDEWALSFFNSAEAILAKWDMLRDREDADVRYGTHFGAIDLTQADGLMGPASAHGHIGLHVYETAPAMPPRVTSAQPLPKSDGKLDERFDGNEP